jgi:hypothetical protein
MAMEVQNANNAFLPVKIVKILAWERNVNPVSLDWIDACPIKSALVVMDIFKMCKESANVNPTIIIF